MAENINSRNVSVIKDVDGKNIVMINDIVFKGKKYLYDVLEIKKRNEQVLSGISPTR